MTTTKDLIARAANHLRQLAPHARTRDTAALLGETTSALERLTQPVGVGPDKWFLDGCFYAVEQRSFDDDAVLPGQTPIFFAETVARLQSELEDARHQCKIANQEHFDMEQQLAAAQEWNERYAIELRELREQKPVAKVVDVNSVRWLLKNDGVGLGDALYARPVPAAQAVPGVDWLANVIRAIDGNHNKGAGAIAEGIVAAMLANHPAQTLDRAVERATLKDAGHDPQ